MYTLNFRGKLFTIDQPVVMGIINTTPDSFYENSRQEDTSKAVDMAGRMLEEGAACIDIGGQSTRPGSSVLPASEEEARVLPVLEAIIKAFPAALISIDTFYGSVAKTAVNTGAGIINDVSAGLFDTGMMETVASLQVPYICMHHRGIPADSSKSYTYENMVAEIIDFFVARISLAHAAGIKDIIIDPGFGFGKSIAQNFLLLKEMSALQVFGLPVLAGLSRKATVYKTLGVSAADALNGTTVLNTLAVLNGASILRVHDVKQAAEAIKLVSVYRNSL